MVKLLDAGQKLRQNIYFCAKVHVNPKMPIKKEAKIIIMVLLPMFFISATFTPLSLGKYKLKTVVIDAGHGGKDPGCSGAKAIEKDIALNVALQLGKQISAAYSDVKVIYTRKTDVFVELHDRAGIANKNNADLFISIHCNSNPKNIYGSETYTMGMHTSENNLSVAKRENSVILQEDNYLEKYNGFNPNSPLAHIFFANVQSAHIENSLKFASMVETQFKVHAGRSSRGVKQAGFLVLWKTSMPSVLIELGYLTHAAEEKYLNSAAGQNKMADAVFRAFKQYKKEVEGG
jgi:N-acetylmuramoyl-L-alanine amidase